MIQKIDYYDLLAYDKILIYGAGIAGTRLLCFLSAYGFDKSKIVVWDRKYDEIKNKCGFTVSEPDFAHFNNAENAIVIIALYNESLVNELEQEFVNAGYKNITASEKISLIAKKVKIDDFENKGYTDCVYQDDVDFSEFKPLVKAIAYYLPQFHEIPENNEWWGKGFTEWTNTSKAKPKFKGHYQPREPHDDLGYYDLSNVDIIRKQAEIAKRHGIYGWCIYYYWFSGKKLLEKPIDLLLENKDIDINFCLMWCNDSWTKIWTGEHKEELIKCEIKDDDPEKFIGDMKKYVDDKRYIRINGKPLIAIYLIQNIPDIRDVIHRWRKRALEIGIGEIAVFSTILRYSAIDLGVQDCFDGETNFSPLRYRIETIQLEDAQGFDISNHISRYADCFDFYKSIVESNNHNHRIYLSCMCGWDNTPRYNKEYFICDLDFSASDFYKMVKYITEEALAYKKDFIFVFAWNEWAEGAYLEPDKKFGYAMLNTFSKAICGLI